MMGIKESEQTARDIILRNKNDAIYCALVHHFCCCVLLLYFSFIWDFFFLSFNILMYSTFNRSIFSLFFYRKKMREMKMKYINKTESACVFFFSFFVNAKAYAFHFISEYFFFDFIYSLLSIFPIFFFYHKNEKKKKKNQNWTRDIPKQYVTFLLRIFIFVK